MTDSWIDVGQSATKVEAAPASKFLKKEEAADSKVGEEAINEKMKVLRVEQKAEEYVTPAAGDAGDESSTSQSRKRGLSSLSKFTALIIGPGFVDAGASVADVLRKHYEGCGSIENISVYQYAGRASIDFTSLESLKKALRLDKPSVCGHPAKIYRLFDNSVIFRAVIRGFDARELDDLGTLRNHFQNYCGEIEDIIVPSPEYAYIDFVSKASLYKALELNNTNVGEHPVNVKIAYSSPSMYKAEVRGFDTGAGAEKVNKALRNHFQICGWIEEISVYDGYAYIAFASSGGLFKALDLNNSKIDGHLVTVRPQEFDLHTSRFSADISWPHDLKDLRRHFEKCGGIAGISYRSYSAAWIYFTSLDSLNEALKLNNTTIDGNHMITVKKRNACCGRGGRGGGRGGRGGRSGYRGGCGGGSGSETDLE